MAANMFDVVALLGDLEVAIAPDAEFEATVRGLVDSDDCVKIMPSSLAYDQTARPPIVPPAHLTELEVEHPPIPIRNVHDAKKAAAMRLGVLFGTPEGPAVITYP